MMRRKLTNFIKGVQPPTNHPKDRQLVLRLGNSSPIVPENKANESLGHFSPSLTLVTGVICVMHGAHGK